MAGKVENENKRNMKNVTCLGDRTYGTFLRIALVSRTDNFCECFQQCYISSLLPLRFAQFLNNVCAYEMKNQASKKHAYLKPLSKQRRMAFFFLRYLFFLPEILKFPLRCKLGTDDVTTENEAYLCKE